MECNKRNPNIRYAIFRGSNFKKLSEYLVLQFNIFLYFCDRFSKLKYLFLFLDRYFLYFWQICQNEMSHFFENDSPKPIKFQIPRDWLRSVSAFS